MIVAIPALALFLTIAAAAGALVTAVVFRRRLSSELTVQESLREEKSRLDGDLARAEDKVLKLEAELGEAQALAKELLSAPPPAPTQPQTPRELPRESGISEIGPVVYPSKEELASLAEKFWQAAGAPAKRDREFWFQAEAQLLRERVQVAISEFPEAPAQSSDLAQSGDPAEPKERVAS